METRKLVQSGLGSCVIAVPKDWLDRHKLRKGDALAIDRQGDTLVLRSSAVNAQLPKRLSLAMSDSVHMLTRKLISAYIEGYAEVLIRGEREREKDAVISNQIEHLAGYEIIEKQHDRLLVRDLLKLEGISLQETFRKMDTNLRMMFTQLCAEARTSIKQPEHFTEEDKLINKLLYTICRLTRAVLRGELLQKEFDNFYDILLLYELSNAVEELGDHLKYLARELSVLPPTRQQEMGAIASKLAEEYALLIDAYHKENRNAAYEFLERKEGLHALCVRILQKQRGQEMILVSRRIRAILITLTQIAKIVRYE